MHVFGLLLTTLISFLIFPTLSHSALSRRQDSGNSCPPITCADPQTVQGSQCGNCEGSQCMLRGCIRSNAFGFTWRPSPCTTCSCENGRELCTVADCVPTECYGFPVIRRPERCCEECDFNVSATECAAVPTGTRMEEVSIGDISCQQTVIEQRCDKMYIVEEDGSWFRCDAVQGEVTRLTQNLPQSSCSAQVTQVTYQTVAQCVKRRLSINEIPLDYDPDPYSCYYLNPTVDPPADSTADHSSTTAVTTTNAGGFQTVGSATPTATPTVTLLLCTFAMVVYAALP